MLITILISLVWLHNTTYNPDPPPDVEYPVFERDFINRQAYLRFLES
mgnify:CR=1 FL=1